ncbi:MAG: ATP synthase F1 subunit delta [Acidobacteria bacterium]|nr:ATP synthase F1 subunit delta [Acidobacteriota bacterium]
MIRSSVLVKYARALAELAVEAEIQERVKGELKSLKELFEGDPEIGAFFENPAVRVEHKRQVLGQVLQRAEVHPVTQNFAGVLLDHHRLSYLSQIYEAFVRQLDQLLGVLRARIVVADGFSDPARERLVRRLRLMTGKEVKAEFETDPALIGGAVVQIGSTIYDGSVWRQLEEIRKRLSQE